MDHHERVSLRLVVLLISRLISVAVLALLRLSRLEVRMVIDQHNCVGLVRRRSPSCIVTAALVTIFTVDMSPLGLSSYFYLLSSCFDLKDLRVHTSLVGYRHASLFLQWSFFRKDLL